MQQAITLSADRIQASTPGALRANLKPLTSVRFFAALSVLLFHFGAGMVARLGAPVPLRNLFANGYVGVTFFFVLSGFLLTYSYFDRLSNAAQMRDYAVSRLARLYPVYLLGLALLVPEYLPHANLVEALRVITVTQSWTLPLATLPAAWNTPAWTLSIELAFYIVFPVILAGLRRTRRWQAIVGIFTCAAVIVGLGTAGVSPGGSGPIVRQAWLAWVPFPLIRGPEFLLGALLGLAFVRRWFRLPRLAAPLAGAAIIGVMCATQASWVPGAVCLGAAVLILGLAQTAGEGTHRLLSSTIMVRLGASSYALYLMQIGVKRIFSAAFTGRLDVFGRLLFPVCLIGLSVLVFLYFEEPCRRLIQRAFSAGKPRAVQRG